MHYCVYACQSRRDGFTWKYLRQASQNHSLLLTIYLCVSLHQKRHGVIALKNHICLIGRMLIRGEDASQGLNDKLTSLNKSRFLLKRSARCCERERREQPSPVQQHPQLNTFNNWTQDNLKENLQIKPLIITYTVKGYTVKLYVHIFYSVNRNKLLWLNSQLKIDNTSLKL